LPELTLFPLPEDQLEALRLCDLEGFDQTEAGERMGVSRGTVQRLLKDGRATLVRAIVENTALLIAPENSDQRPEGADPRQQRANPARPSENSIRATTDQSLIPVEEEEGRS
jgi:predicted DNA-binding protein (UPF0251 family)